MKSDNLSEKVRSLHDWELIEKINEYNNNGYNQDDLYWNLRLEEERRGLDNQRKTNYIN